VKSFPISKSGRNKIARAITRGWCPGLPPSWFYRGKKRRHARQEAVVHVA
jgi:hypothetical protein